MELIVAGSNGVWLLFLLVSGVIACAVDFSNGTIYLAGAHYAALDVQRLEDANDRKALETLLSEKAGQPVTLSSELVKIEEVESLDEALAMVRMSGVMDDEKLSTM